MANSDYFFIICIAGCSFPPQILTSSVRARSGECGLEGGDLGGLLLLNVLDRFGFRWRSNRQVVGLGSREQVLSILEGTERGMT